MISQYTKRHIITREMTTAAAINCRVAALSLKRSISAATKKTMLYDRLVTNSWCQVDDFLTHLYKNSSNGNPRTNAMSWK